MIQGSLLPRGFTCNIKGWAINPTNRSEKARLHRKIKEGSKRCEEVLNMMNNTNLFPGMDVNISRTFKAQFMMTIASRRGVSSILSRSAKIQINFICRRVVYVFVDASRLCIRDTVFNQYRHTSVLVHENGKGLN